MKNVSTILSALALVGVIILFSMHFSGTKNAGANLPANVSTASNGVIKVAYVDVDTLEANYTFLKNKKEAFRSRQEQMDQELQRSYQQMESDAAEVRKKAEANNLSQTEYQAAQKRLMQMQQSLETRKQTLTDQLLKDQNDFNKELKDRLDNFLATYNKDKHYDYIFSYSSSGSGSILFANKMMNITPDVIKGMNALPVDMINKK